MSDWWIFALIDYFFLLFLWYPHGGQQHLASLHPVPDLHGNVESQERGLEVLPLLLGQSH